jgi:hypothetical protein
MRFSVAIVSPRFSASPPRSTPSCRGARRTPAASYPLPDPKSTAFPGTLPPNILSCSCAYTMAPGLWSHENQVTISGGNAMDDTTCRDFFLHPTQILHRQYEAVRAVFLEHRPLPQVAQQFGYGYGSLRNLVADFRTRCHAGQAPPFSPNRPAVDPTARARSARPLSRRRLPPPTAANSFSHPGVACAPASPGSSCSCRCWHACTSTPWWPRPVIPAHAWSRPRRRC